MIQTYLHLSGRDHDVSILKTYEIEVKEDSSIDSERPLNFPRSNEPKDKITRLCWKCGTIPDKTLINEKLKEEAPLIEKNLLNFDILDQSTKKIIVSFPLEFKD